MTLQISFLHLLENSLSLYVMYNDTDYDKNRTKYLTVTNFSKFGVKYLIKSRSLMFKITESCKKKCIVVPLMAISKLKTTRVNNSSQT